MKKSIVSILGLAILFMSCSKEDRIQKNESTISQSINQAKSTTDKKLIYRTLTSAEKVEFWNNKLDYLSSVWDLTDAQKKSIDELRVFISIKTFEKSNLNEKFTERANQWSLSALKLFTYKDVYILAYSLNNDDSFSDEIVPPQNKDCDCNQGSVVTCMWHLEGSCTSKKCKIQLNDCGFLLMYDCDGLCSDAMIEDQS